jgi:DNA-binding response OmpR family regulator
MNETCILVVDDSIVILELVKHILEQETYSVWTAVSGDEALQTIKRKGLPHLAIVDINMPGMDGFTFCEQVHKFSDLPIILLSAEESEVIVVEGLMQHAEDYMVKPKSGPLRAEELKARVFSVLNRVGDFGYTLAPLVTVDDNLQVDFSARRAIVGGETLKLTPTETKMLHILMHHAGRTLPFSYLLRRLWPLEEAFEDRLHTHVYRLRKKIEANPREPQYVLSEWGKGYTFPAAMT